jgi:hypothetical protein
MVRLVPLLCIAGLWLTPAGLAGCGGKTLWLGEVPVARDGGGGDGSDTNPVVPAVDVGIDVGATCSHGQVSAGEVLWIGDSWILIPGSLRTHLRDLARAASTIGPTEDYANGAVAASTMSAIAGQYATQEAGGTKVKVVLMDGGTWDTIQSNGADATVTAVANTFTQFLAKAASDGTVEHVVYFLQPEVAGIPGVAALRSPMQQACAQSKVPCHFLDLQPLWQGHSDYVATSGGLPFPTDTGAIALADAIWGIMQNNCIAQ